MARHHPVRFSPFWIRSLAAAVLTVGLLAAPLGALGVSSVTVEILADSYSPKTLTVEAGTTVVFKNTSLLPHTAQADDGSFDTGLISPGASKSVTLQATGVFPFYCLYHGAVGGSGQSGTITVTAAAATTPTPRSNPTMPSSATLPDPPGGADGLAILAFAVAALGSVVLAITIDEVRGAARRRSGR